MAGFCKLADGLQTSDLADSEAKSPIVSAGYLKYSRFWETATGDWVRSALDGRCRSIQATLCYPKMRGYCGIGSGGFDKTCLISIPAVPPNGHRLGELQPNPPDNRVRCT